MQRLANTTGITGTKDGSNVTFTLTSTSIAGGATFIAHNGLFLKQVTATPAVNEFSLSGATVTLGLAPAAGDSLFGFIQTSQVHGLKRVSLSGVQNGSTVTFILPETPASGSDILFFFNGVLQEEVSSITSANEFTLSGTSLTTWVAPTATDSLIVYVQESPATALFRKLTLTGTQNGSNQVFLTGTTMPADGTLEILLVFSHIQQRQISSGSPSTNEFSVSTDGTSITLWIAPAAADMLEAYVVGAPSADTTVASSLLRLEQIAGRLLVLTNEQIDQPEAIMCLDEAWRNLLNGWEWSFAKTDGVLTTVPSSSAGTVTVTQGSAVVFGASTSFVAADLGSVIFLGGDPYRISSVDVASQFLQLSSPYTGTGAAGQSYEIWQNRYLLDVDVDELFSIAGPNWQLEERTLSWLDWVDADREVQGEPYVFAYVGYTTAGRMEIELWPVPTERYQCRYQGWRRTTLDDKDEVVQNVSSLLLQAGASQACEIVYAKTGENRWLTLAERYQLRYRALLPDFRKMDNLRHGRISSRSGTLPANLAGRTDLDLAFVG